MWKVFTNNTPTLYPLLIIEKCERRAAFGFPVVPDVN